MRSKNAAEAEQLWINFIRESTETINKYAEQWVKDINMQTGIDITIRIRANEVPIVECCTTLIPEGLMKRNRR